MLSINRYVNIRLQNYLKNYPLTKINSLYRAPYPLWIGGTNIYKGVDRIFNNTYYQDEMKEFIQFIDYAYMIGNNNGYNLGNDFQLHQCLHHIKDGNIYDRDFQINNMHHTIDHSEDNNISKPLYSFIYLYMVDGIIELHSKNHKYMMKEHDIICIDRNNNTTFSFSDPNIYKRMTKKPEGKYGLLVMNCT
jgi:hypothetical protein